MTVTTDDGVRLWVSRSGEGEPLVLCHGGPGLWDMFEDVGAMLRDRVTVVRWDQRGCGRSQRCDGPWTSARFVADLDAVRAHFGFGRIALLGHSWGAQLALGYTLAHPERVSALVYVSGTGIGPNADWHSEYRRNLLARLGEHPERLARWRQLTGRRSLTREEERESAVLQWSVEFEDRERALEHARDMADPWFPVNTDGNRALNEESKRACGTPELYAACRRLDVPVLIVDGARDIRPRSAVDSLERALPDARRVILPEAGHLPWVEDPRGFRAAVLTAL
ncbi:alpha/beta fold hydrolase [Streptomyces sp. A012304]|uniref:alpha/beta fold hydrolase n=1 Tax=Streptomyces sp. A012304 TaxID=375446 RepID=UPI0022308A4A|nr:alpha/beta hydrolase [Streptomyces sp. A012304]GKQ41564.1 putative 2-succinyl-6-hydroxy-2,4-cyclohexadiene-1-carboxylate synthase [Streptomyces sp. A012304]